MAARSEVGNEGRDALFAPLCFASDPTCNLFRNVDGDLRHKQIIIGNYIMRKPALRAIYPRRMGRLGSEVAEAYPGAARPGIARIADRSDEARLCVEKPIVRR